MPSHPASSTRAVVLVAIAPVAALLACDVGELDLHIFSDAGWSWGDAGWFAGECTTDQQCEAGQCCVNFLGGSCKGLVWTGPGQSICSTFPGDEGGLCWCFPLQTEPMCPPPLFEPPVKPECEPRPYVKCALFCPEKSCVCSTHEGGLAGAGVEVPSCPPPDWSIPCPSSDGGVAD